MDIHAIFSNAAMPLSLADDSERNRTLQSPPYSFRYTDFGFSSFMSVSWLVGLLPSGGSDHHGAYKPYLSIGTGDGTVSVPDEVLEALRERAG